MVKEMIKATLKLTSKYAPELLIGAGLGGLVGAVYLGTKAGAKASKIVEECKAREEDGLEIVKKVAPVYGPVVLLAGASAASIVAGTVTNHKRMAAIATACTLSQSALKEYKETMLEEVGEKKIEKVEEKIHQKRAEKAARNSSMWDNMGEFDENTESDDARVRCVFEMTGEAFAASKNDIVQAVNRVNHDLGRAFTDFVSWDDLRYEIGEIADFPDLCTSRSMYSKLGWNPDAVGREGLTVKCPWAITTDGVRYRNIIFSDDVAPRWDYSELR